MKDTLLINYSCYYLAKSISSMAEIYIEDEDSYTFPFFYKISTSDVEVPVFAANYYVLSRCLNTNLIYPINFRDWCNSDNKSYTQKTLKDLLYGDMYNKCFVKIKVNENIYYQQKGILLNENFKPLLIIYAKYSKYFETTDLKVKIDTSLFDLQGFSIIRNAFFKTLLYDNITVEISDLKNSNIIESPIIPDSVLKNNTQEVLKNNINNYLIKTYGTKN